MTTEEVGRFHQRLELRRVVRADSLLHNGGKEQVDSRLIGFDSVDEFVDSCFDVVGNLSWDFQVKCLDSFSNRIDVAI